MFRLSSPPDRQLAKATSKGVAAAAALERSSFGHAERASAGLQQLGGSSSCEAARSAEQARAASAGLQQVLLLSSTARCRLGGRWCSSC